MFLSFFWFVPASFHFVYLSFVYDLKFAFHLLTNTYFLCFCFTRIRWELAWCDELWQGPYDIFWDWIDTASCTITLTSCTQVPTPAPLLHVVDQVQEGGDVHANTEKKNLIAEPLRLAMNN